MTPDFRITGLAGIVRSRLISLSVTDESTEQSDTCTIELSDPRNEFNIPSQGHVIQIAMGYADNLRDMGSFVIDGIKIAGPAHRITLDAKAAPFTTAGGFSPVQTRNTRSFDNITIGDLVRTIAGEHGLTPAVSPELASVVLNHIDQTNESDINLLTRLARQFKAVCKPTFGRLVFATRGESKSISGQTLPTVTLTPRDVISWDASLGKRTDFEKVQTTYYDNATGETIVYDAESEQLTEGGQIYQHPMPFASETEAKAAGASMLDQFSRGAQELSITMPGNPELMSEAVVTLSGFHPKLDLPWLVKRVQHSISTSGYTASLSCEIPGGEAGNERKSAQATSVVTYNPDTDQLQ